jgi:hypothetical protein
VTYKLTVPPPRTGDDKADLDAIFDWAHELSREREIDKRHIRDALLAGGAIAVGSNYIELDEMEAPATPGTNQGRLYIDASGAGSKSQLLFIFQSGAPQVLASEP